MIQVVLVNAGKVLDNLNDFVFCVLSLVDFILFTPILLFF